MTIAHLTRGFSLATLLIALSLLVVAGCEGDNPAVPDPPVDYPNVDRHDKLPADIVKRTPATDIYPPVLHSDEFEDPIPLPGPINTNGAEDSPFILPDGKTMYFFFTPDVRIQPDKQLLDSVSGVWVSHLSGGEWDEAERLWLNAPGVLSLDGAVCVQEDEMWFASAREGFADVNMFTATWQDGRWMDWTYAGDYLNQECQIGEVHLHGDALYFHSDREGGLGDYDIWMTTRDGDIWSDPLHVDAVNSAERDGWPFVSLDGNELWFTRTYQGAPAIYRAVRDDGNWSEPELIVSSFAGEPTLDDAGNLYFVHHFVEDSEIIEADIYVAYKK